MRNLSFFALSGALLLLAAAASEPNEQVVAPDARWVVHVDLHRARASDFGRYLLGDESPLGHLIRGARSLEEQTGVDPLKAFDAVTLSASGYRDAAPVAVLHANRPVGEALARYRERWDDGRHERVVVDGRSIDHFRDGDDSRYVYLLKGNEKEQRPDAGEQPSTVIVSRDATTMRRTIARMDRPTSMTDAATPEVLLGRSVSDAMLYVAALDLDTVDEHGKSSSAASCTKSLFVEFAEQDGRCLLKMRLLATSEKSAAYLERLVKRTAWHMTRFAERKCDEGGGEDQPGKDRDKRRIDLDKALTTERNGNRVDATLELSAGELEDLLRGYRSWVKKSRERASDRAGNGSE